MSLRVLIVDDYPDTRRSLRLLLAAWGYESREAPDGPQALREAESFCPDVVVLDIAMPGMDGYEVARQLRRRPPCSRPLLVALTGHTRPQDVEAAVEAGMDHFFAKPCHPGQLEFLMRWCARARQVQPQRGAGSEPEPSTRAAGA
jgi:CheY-like chemotaxis protein